MSIKRPRDHSFDVMKGIAIYTVVMGHVLMYAAPGLTDTLLLRVISLSHMPLFFFISGYFSYKEVDGRKFTNPDLWSRFKQLIIPMVVMSALFCAYRAHSHLHTNVGLSDDYLANIRALWLDNAKWGYWFTICLFEVIVIYRMVCPLMRTARKTVTQVAIIAATFILLIAASQILPESAASIFEVKFVATYTPIFLMGVMARLHRERFDKLLRNQWATTSALVCGGIILGLLAYKDSIGFMSATGVTLILIPVWHLLLVVVAFAVIRPWVESSAGGDTLSAPVRMWSFLGRNSLGIYMLQYFFLFPMPWFNGALHASALQMVPTFALSFIASGLIVAVCCGTIAIVRTSRYMALLMLGDPIKRS